MGNRQTGTGTCSKVEADRSGSPFSFFKSEASREEYDDFATLRDGRRGVLTDRRPGCYPRRFAT